MRTIPSSTRRRGVPSPPGPPCLLPSCVFVFRMDPLSSRYLVSSLKSPDLCPLSFKVFPDVPALNEPATRPPCSNPPSNKLFLSMRNPAHVQSRSPPNARPELLSIRALDRYEIASVPTNLSALRAVSRCSSFLPDVLTITFLSASHFLPQIRSLREKPPRAFPSSPPDWLPTTSSRFPSCGVFLPSRSTNQNRKLS
jgi:hypothetical protein